ncbi:MAG TPA: hypothetical protein VM073_02760 [Usitatibacter sp.]|nr:hypothetical protein [Usitatibacter sp.]
MLDVRRIATRSLVGGLFIGSIEFAQAQGLLAAGWNDHLLWLARLVAHWSIACLPLAAAWSAFDARPGTYPLPPRGYVLAVAAAAFCGAVIMAAHGRFVDPALGQWAIGIDMELGDRFLYGLWVLGFWGAVGAALHAADARQRGFAERLRGAELSRIARAERLARSDLAALHARYEPDHLVAALRRIEVAYGVDRSSADRLLDELIQESRACSRQLEPFASSGA